MPTRRQFLYTGAAAVTGLAALGTDGYFESYRLQLKRIEIPLRRLPHQFDGFTIVQLSDFHYEEEFSAIPIRRSVDLINGLHPDLVVLTGDFVTVPMFRFGLHAARLAANAVFPCAALLSGIKAQMGSFAILGNHDAYSNPALVASGLRSHGIPLLKNSCVPIERDGARLWMAGVDDALEGQPDLGAAIEKIPAAEPIILLCPRT